MLKILNMINQMITKQNRYFKVTQKEHRYKCALREQVKYPIGHCSKLIYVRLTKK